MNLSVRSSGRDAALALATVVAAWVVLMWPWLVDGLTIPWDAKIHFQAMLRWLSGHLAEGDWPLWMPETFGGRPALGDPQSLLLSPGFLALAAFDSEPSARAGDAVVLVEVLIGGLATVLFGLRRGWHPAAAVLAGLVMMVGGSASARLQHTLLVQSHAFIPVVLLALDIALDRPTLLRSVCAGAAVGWLVVGRDQVAYLGLIGLGVFVVARALAADDRRAFLRERMVPAAVAATVAAAVAAIPVLATLEFAQISNRPAFEFAFGAKQSLPPVAFLTALVPDLFGGLASDLGYWGPGSMAWTPHVPVDRTVVQLYAGAVPVVLVLWIGVLRGRLLTGPGRLIGILLLFFAIYALGRYTPVFELLFDTLPGVDKFRRPADATFAFAAMTALAAGWLLDRVLRDGLPPVPAWRGVAEVAGGVALLAAAAWVAEANGRLNEALPALATALVLAGLAVAAVALCGAGRHRPLVLVVLIGLSMVDLRTFATGTLLNARPVAPFAVLDEPEEVPLAAWLEREVTAIEAREGPVRLEVLGLGGAWQNAALVLGLESTLGYNPLRLEDYDVAVGARQNSHLAARQFGTLMTGYRSDFADLLGVRLIVLGAPIEQVDPASAPAFGPPRRIGPAWIYDNPRAVPRVLFIGRESARPYDPEALVASGGLPALDWRREALIDPLPLHVAMPPDRSQPGSVRILDRRSDRIDLDVSAARDGFAVLHDMAYPGWVVYVDGMPQEPFRANVLFMAAAVPAGRHAVTFAYEPLAPRHLWSVIAGDHR
ncbi:MAG: hypothetical protein RLO51_23670 [Thalassobaculum sp.]|uniref:hypothetical protein n=1 Tax=Thalassobaculum sp. TaxID=2022740 RepID=UPI0032ED97F7